MSRSLSAARARPRHWRYHDNPPPYSPYCRSPRSASPDSDPPPPLYPDHVLPDPDTENKAEVANNNQQANVDNLKTQEEDGAPNVSSLATFDRQHVDDIVHIPDDDESDGKIPNQDLPNKPRNPPIVSEIEEELKPGNRSKNVSDLFGCESNPISPNVRSSVS